MSSRDFAVGDRSGVVGGACLIGDCIWFRKLPFTPFRGEGFGRTTGESLSWGRVSVSWDMPSLVFLKLSSMDSTC